MSVRIGTSGWSYDSWRGVLYERGLPPGRWLERYAEEFSTVELNGSFYRWPGEARFDAWMRRLPEDFTFTVKAPRGLTHARKLADPSEWIARIVRVWEVLGARRGVLLVQLPPDFARDDERLTGFLAAVPAGIRVAVEFRHGSWLDESVFGILERAGAAYVVMSGAHLPCILRATAPFVYVRLHGPDPEHLYAGSYDGAAIGWWADRIREWDAAGLDVYAYFNNDGYGHAVRDARALEGALR
ncbi:hypothetical protein CVS47_01894 [Microbacterium lemovicicum]|uniref:DUF72 domain-containing protein n=1 Tax=Microbacterium lemovicicum TaxID=1072463 RepID=A0A3Q9J1G3_9MICO|nr:DUF72 domain-containing protein [Microbacterium lemovicicum]AZS37260.1 hypothetical protein CVS47_01894 [Microbacterium lemovicicum]